MAKEASKPLTFSIKDGEFKGKYEITGPAFYVPGIGKVTAEQMIKMPQLLADLVKIESGAVKKID